MRFWAACFLGELGEKTRHVTTSLESAVEDVHGDVRCAARIALERIDAAERAGR